MSDKPQLILGIDQGLGTKSPTGAALFDSSGKIYDCKNIWASKKFSLQEKLNYINIVLKYVESKKPVVLGRPVICIESTVMRGKGGESLQRLVGAIISNFPNHEIRHVQNTGVKKIVGGSGDCDKAQVAKGVRTWFEGANKNSLNVIDTLIEEEEWDILDALAIGIAGYHER